MKRLFIEQPALNGSVAYYNVKLNQIFLDRAAIAVTYPGRIGFVGVCIHELVHYLQWNILGDIDWTRNWPSQLYRREIAAYLVQSIFLALLGIQLRRSLRRMALMSIIGTRRNLPRLFWEE